MTFKPIDPKRDSFRQYMERSGVIESLTKSFAKLFDVQQRPENPMDYVRTNLGDSLIERDQIAELQLELKEAQDEIKELKKTLSLYEPLTIDDSQAIIKTENSSMENLTIYSSTAEECIGSASREIVIKTEQIEEDRDSQSFV